MLITINSLRKLFHSLIALLFIISCIAIHLNVSAEEIYELSAEEYRIKGFEAQKKGDLNDALKNYNQSLSLGLKNAAIYNDIGVIYEKIGVFLRAEDYYLKAIDVDQGYLPSYMNLAYLYLENGFPKRAIVFFKKRYELGSYADKWTNRAKRELLRLNPKYQKWVKKVEAKRLKQESKSLEEEVLNIARNKFEKTIQSAEDHYNFGQKFLEDGRYVLAEAEFEKALRLTPNNPKIIQSLLMVPFKKGQWLFEKGLFKESIAAFDESLKVKSENKEVMNARNKAVLELIKKRTNHHLSAASQMLNSGDCISAKKEIRKVLTIIPNESITISK